MCTTVMMFQNGTLNAKSQITHIRRGFENATKLTPMYGAVVTEKSHCRKQKLHFHNSTASPQLNSFKSKLQHQIALGSIIIKYQTCSCKKSYR